MKTSDREETPATVSRPCGSKQAGDIRARWAWTEPSVWTEPMLTALEQGGKGGQWFSLMDKVYAPRNLDAAFSKVRRNGGGAGVDHQTVQAFKHSHWNVFPRVDGWVRMRLRSVLRKRAHRSGRGRGKDHQRWPNAYFARQGLSSLQEAYAKARQSSKR